LCSREAVADTGLCARLLEGSAEKAFAARLMDGGAILSLLTEKTEEISSTSEKNKQTTNNNQLQSSSYYLIIVDSVKHHSLSLLIDRLVRKDRHKLKYPACEIWIAVAPYITEPPTAA
jgi:hypothetical protein